MGGWVTVLVALHNWWGRCERAAFFCSFCSLPAEKRVRWSSTARHGAPACVTGGCSQWVLYDLARQPDVMAGVEKELQEAGLLTKDGKPGAPMRGVRLGFGAVLLPDVIAVRRRRPPARAQQSLGPCPTLTLTQPCNTPRRPPARVQRPDPAAVL